MQSLEERVAYLEGRMEDNAAIFGEIRSEMREFRTEMREFRSEVARQFAAVNNRFSVQDDKIDRHFMWMLGAQFAVLLSVIGALAAAYFQRVG